MSSAVGPACCGPGEEVAAMSTGKTPDPAAIRARLTHPVVDSDGHWLEFGPAITEYLERVGGRGVQLAQRADLARSRAYRERTPRRAPCATDLVVLSDPEHARPRDRDAPAPALRAPRRARAGLLRTLPDHRACRTLHRQRRVAPGGLPRLQHFCRRAVRPIRRSDDAGGGGPDEHAGRGDRRTRARGEDAQAQGRLSRSRPRRCARRCSWAA